MHFGSLPLYRGAGGFSWQILHNHDKLCAHIHQLVEKTDAGPIVLSICASLSVDQPNPRDFHNLSVSLADSIVDSFAKRLCFDTTLSLDQQDEFNAIYFPRLNTSKDGLIDFRLKYSHLERFIRAFSHPYPGAWFIYKDQVFHCHKCSLIHEFDFHPFAFGLIVNTLDNGLCVSCSDSIVLLSDIYDQDSTAVDSSFFRIGLRLQTTPSFISQ